MKRFLPTLNRLWHRRLLRQHSAAVGVGLLLVVGGLMLKPAPRSNADVPEGLAVGDRQQRQAKAAFRVEQRQEQQRQIRPENFDLGRYPVTNQNEKYWRNLLWTTAVVQPQESFVASTIEQVLAMAVRSDLTDSQKRTIDAAARVGTQLYLSDPSRFANVGEQFRQTIDRSPDPEWVAMALSGLARSGLSPEQIQTLVGRVKARFPNWAANVALQTTLRDVAELLSPSPMPPLKDLLNWTIAPGQAQMYVLCQQNREVLCQTVLRDRNGTFLRQQDGQLWSVPLLLRSIHALSWNFIRGETPQGIFRMEGEVPQPDDAFFRAYGQFALVNLFIPFEGGAKAFIPGKPGSFQGSLEDYKRLLPPSWRNHWAIQESFWAGKVGRSFFRIHGTGESPEFFSGKDKNPDTYNWNPTIGCLSALELYSEQGQLLQADMPKILQALQTVGGKNFAGYLIVVDLPGNATQPIALEAIEAAIGNGKRSLRTNQQAQDHQADIRSPIARQPTSPPATASSPATASLPVTLPSPASSQPAPSIAQKTRSPTVEPIAPPNADTTPAPTPETPIASPPTQPELHPTTRPVPIAY